MLFDWLILSFIGLLTSIVKPIIYDTSNGLMVNISSGQLEGQTLTSDGGRQFFAYRGIPYGEPPTGNLRFQPPVAKGKWEGVLNASVDGPFCIQFNYMVNKLVGQEDCLHLNIYIPVSPASSKTLLPVIVYIHGGAFSMGSSVKDDVGPEKMMDYDILLVTINYRLGPFGFLNTEDENLPGNYALLDQVLALNWVKENINEFGGDPNKVTIAGTSAGSWSVMLHMVSPISKGLFKGAIAQSGSPFGRWGNWFDSKQNVPILAKLLNCSTSEISSAIECLRKSNATEIILKVKELDDLADTFSLLRFHPVKDSNRGLGAFLPESPSDLLEHGTTFNKVPLIIGVTNDEASFVYDSYVYSTNSSGSDHFQKGLLVALQKFLGISDGDSKLLRDAIVKEYFSHDPKDEDEISWILSKVYGDFTFDCLVDEIIEKTSSIGIPTYAYRFTYSKGVADFTGYSQSLTYKKQDHVNHGEDYTYIFKSRVLAGLKEWYTVTEKDRKITKMLLETWINFAYNDVPESDSLKVKWLPSTPTQPTYLNINLNPVMVNGHLSNHTQFWKSNMKTLIKNGL